MPTKVSNAKKVKVKVSKGHDPTSNQMTLLCSPRAYKIQDQIRTNFGDTRLGRSHTHAEY